jgi:hypothetical protein
MGIENYLTLNDGERKRVANYFQNLIKLGDVEKMEVFRVLGHMYETDPVLSQFMNLHDMSVYRTAEYWGSSQGRMLPSIRD